MKLTASSGYIVDGEFTTRVHWDWQEADGELPKEVVATDEQRQQYEDSPDEVYRATDGKLFFDYEEAQAYQKTVSLPELDEVMEQLSKVALLCSASKDKSPLFETIADAIKQLQSDGGEEMMEKYYDSTC